MPERIADTLCELIGETPLVRLDRFGADLPGEIVGKLELRNPLASVKDRVGIAIPPPSWRSARGATHPRDHRESPGPR